METSAVSTHDNLMWSGGEEDVVQNKSILWEVYLVNQADFFQDHSLWSRDSTIQKTKLYLQNWPF